MRLFRMEISSDDSDEYDDEAGLMASAPSRGWRLVAPAALASALALTVLGVGVAFWPRAAASTPATGPPAERLLESQELVDTVVKHTVSFHKQLGVSSVEFGMTQQELEEQISQGAQDHIRQLLEKVGEQNLEDAQTLRELRITRAQWDKAHSVLGAVHDERVRALGVDVLRDEPSKLAKHTETRRAKVRELSLELIPESARPKEASDWHMFIGPHGMFGAKAQVGDWNAALEIDTEKTHVAARRLLLLGKLLWTIIASTLGGIISVVLLFITGLSKALHPVLSRAMWILQTSLAGATCVTDLGLTLGMPSWQGVVTWIPCMITAAFSGLEAIFEFWQ